MKIFKGIISCFLAFAIAAFSLCVPAYAAIDPGLIIEGAAVAPSFGDWIIGSLQSFEYWVYGNIFDKDVCPRSGPTGNGRHVFETQYTTINGKLGNYYVCQNCGKSAGEVLEPAYQEQVSELPFPSCNSGNEFLISVYPFDHRLYSGSSPATCSEHTVSRAFSGDADVVFLCSSERYIVTPRSGKSSFPFNYVTLDYSYDVVYSGYYERLESPLATVNYTLSDGTTGSVTGSYPATPKIYYAAGAKYLLVVIIHRFH